MHEFPDHCRPYLSNINHSIFVHYHCGLKLHTGTTLRVFQSMSRNKNACHMRVKPTTSTMLTAV